MKKFERVTMFEGTTLDWFRFQNQFETEIDQDQVFLSQETSWSKVRLLIDGVTFTSEGYVMAKVILTSWYGKPSEVVATHIHCITSLHVISNCNPNRIQEFTKN